MPTSERNPCFWLEIVGMLSAFSFLTVQNYMAGLPTQIGYRTTTFEFEGVSDYRREFIGWLLKSCTQDGVEPGDLMDAEAVDLLAERLRTALQIEMHLTVASG